MESSQSNYDEIRYLNLKNQGGFVCKLECYHKSAQSADPERDGSTGKILLGGNETLDLTKVKDSNGNPLPEGEYVTAYANVQAGKDLHSDVWFIYKSASKMEAKFVISGTTTIDSLGYIGLVEKD
jgi:hypothetical protein